MRELITGVLHLAQQQSQADPALRATIPHLDAMAHSLDRGTVDLAELLPVARRLSRALLFEDDLLSTPLGSTIQGCCALVLLLGAATRCRETCQRHLSEHAELSALKDLSEHLAHLQRIIQRDGFPAPRTFLALERIISRLYAEAYSHLRERLDGEEWADLRLAMSELAARYRPFA